MRNISECTAHDQCTRCKNECIAYLRGEKFLTDNKKFQYILCRACCIEFARIPKTNPKHHHRIVAFWNDVFKCL